MRVAANVRRGSGRAYIGFIFGFRNARLGLDLSGSPREVMRGFDAAGVAAKAVAADPLTHMKVAICKVAGSDSLFRAGPRSPGLLYVMDAIREGRFDAAAAVIREDPAVLGADPVAATAALAECAALGQVEAVQLLIEQGVGVNRATPFRMSPLHWAAATGQAAVVDVLLAAGASPAARSWFLLTPGQLAHANKHGPLADALGKRDASPVDAWSTETILRQMGCR